MPFVSESVVNVISKLSRHEKIYSQSLCLFIALPGNSCSFRYYISKAKF
uniref:Uncharacterized protein n=1 Tax=Anguilla anguilla TaxID=7936 RepID=A0A0E9PBB7_ANGAN